MISAIIPTYRSPEGLDLCLRSAVENKVNKDTEIVVVVDGCPEESQHIIDKYKDDVAFLLLSTNSGMQYALNVGVMNASQEFMFILNDDNVFGNRWDERIEAGICERADPLNTVITVNQVEPVDGMFNFVTCDLGRTASTFDYEAWLKFENEIELTKNWRFTPAGRIFPFTVSKRWYMTLGGFDTFYNSPFWCDVDWWLKCELTNQLSFARYHGAHLYHFGSVATKNRGDSEAEAFKRSEGEAAQTFLYKWGFIPNLVENAQQRDNAKAPLDTMIKGIKFN